MKRRADAEELLAAIAIVRVRPSVYESPRMGSSGAMPLSLLLIVIGIVLAIFVHYALGIICIVIGLVLLLLPRLRTGTSRV
jgi:hypothetical protein